MKNQQQLGVNLEACEELQAGICLRPLLNISCEDADPTGSWPQTEHQDSPLSSDLHRCRAETSLIVCRMWAVAVLDEVDELLRSRILLG